MTQGFLFYRRFLVHLLPEGDYGRYLEALAEALPIEVVATDAEGRVIVWNAAMARVAGPREKAVGKHLLEALPWLAADPNLDWHAALIDVLDGGRPYRLARHPLGARVVRATLGAMRGEDEQVLGAALSLEDITRGARQEEQKRMRERVDAVHDLGASLAHELRNPLNALSLNLQLLREQVRDPNAKPGDLEARTEGMIAEVGRVERLITHLLEVSRGGPLRRRKMRVDGIVAAVVARLEGMIRAHDVVVKQALGSRRTLGLDEQRVDRALHNLIQNAVQASAEGGGHVWVTTRDDPHSTVVVVDDDGPGIRPEDRSEVFVLYSTGKRGGTGLGLPLAREDLRRHGGEVEVLSRPGGGARFVVHLPTEESMVEAEE